MLVVTSRIVVTCQDSLKWILHWHRPFINGCRPALAMCYQQAPQVADLISSYQEKYRSLVPFGSAKRELDYPIFMFVMICIDKIATLEYKPPLNKLILPFGWTGPEMASSHCRCHPWSLSSLWQSWTKSKAKHTACSQSLARSLPISTRQICLTRHTWGSEVLSFNNAWWLQIPNHWPPKLAGLTNCMGSLSEFHCTLTLSHGMPCVLLVVSMTPCRQVSEKKAIKVKVVSPGACCWKLPVAEKMDLSILRPSWSFLGVLPYLGDFLNPLCFINFADLIPVFLV